MATDPEANVHFLIETQGNLDYAHWADGPFCPHCGEREAIRTIQGQTARPGIYHCLTCRKRFAGTLDILFQNHKAPPYRGIAVSPLLRRALKPARYALWYGYHIVRQIIMGSDKRPPARP